MVIVPDRVLLLPYIPHGRTRTVLIERVSPPHWRQPIRRYKHELPQKPKGPHNWRSRSNRHIAHYKNSAYSPQPERYAEPAIARSIDRRGFTDVFAAIGLLRQPVHTLTDQTSLDRCFAPAESLANSNSRSFWTSWAGAAASAARLVSVASPSAPASG
jgi:hypothetical protein